MHRSVAGGEAVWSIETHLLASVLDSLQVANWQRSKDGAKASKAPKPLPRPGGLSGEDGSTKYGDASKLTPAEARSILDRLKNKQP